MKPQRKRELIARSLKVMAASGYQCSPGPAPFDLVGVSSIGVVLVFVSDRWPLPSERDQIEQFRVPACPGW